ncbi:hypothetical protein GCM10020331_036120 [Ectobacillus funiculus]
MKKLHRQGVPRTIAIFAYLYFVFGGIGYGVYKAIPIAVSQLQDMNRNFSRVYENVRIMDRRHAAKKFRVFPQFIGERLRDAILGVEAKLQELVNRMMSTARGILDSLLIIVLVPFIVFTY